MKERIKYPELPSMMSGISAGYCPEHDQKSWSCLGHGNLMFGIVPGFLVMLWTSQFDVWSMTRIPIFIENDVRNSASDVRNSASDVWNSASDVRNSASKFRNSANDVWDSASDVRNMTKDPGHIPDIKLQCPEYDQKSWHYSGQIFALSGTWPGILVIICTLLALFQTNLALFRTKLALFRTSLALFQTLFPLKIDCPECDQKSWHYSRQ